MTVGRRGEGIRLLEADDRRLRADAARRTAASVFGVACRWSATSRSRTRWSRPALSSRPAASRRAAFAALERLKGAKGRLELVGERNGAPIFVDYAHKPDALAKALEALRPYVTGRLVVVFGAGGDRDPGKRPLMGAIAAEKADRVIVTDDNPRSEDPAAIRAAILQPRPARSRSATAARRSAAPSPSLRRGDVLLIAGKGHETGQIVGDQVLPFSDHEAVAAALGGRLRMSERPLWTVEAMAEAMRADAPARCRLRSPAFPSTAAPSRPAMRSLRSPATAATATNSCRPRSRRARGWRSSPPASATPSKDAPLLIVPDVLEGLRDLARAARARTQAKVIGVTGSVGKTGTKEALRLALGAGGRDARLGRLLQQPLGRAAVARALSRDRALRRVRDRHEPRRRDRAADAAGAPACRDHHHGRAGASRILRLARGDRRRQGRNLSAASSRAARR